MLRRDYDIINSKLYLPYFPLQTNNIIHSHCTRATTNLKRLLS